MYNSCSLLNPADLQLEVKLRVVGATETFSPLAVVQWCYNAVLILPP